MNKVAIASLLAVSAFSVALFPLAAYGQLPVAGGQITMDAAEQADYDNAMNKAPTPAAQAPLLEAYLVKYPKSQVKTYVLQRIMLDYSSVDPVKALTAADNYLAVAPTNLQAYIIEVAFRKAAAEAMTDPAAKQTGLDSAAEWANKGLAVAKGPKPADMTAVQYKQITDYATPTFYSVIGEDALGKKDPVGAIAAYKAEIAALPPFNPADVTGTDAAKKQAALTYLQETDLLGQAYYAMTPPSYVPCTFYTTRAATFAPDAFKPALQPLADYCYKKFHGTKEGYDDVVKFAQTHATPDGLTITPAPTDADQVNKIMAETKDEELPALAVSDKEYILQYGTTAQADKVFDTIKGKSVEIPDAVVVAATADQLQVSISDDAVQSKTADFTFNMKTPIKTALPAAGTKVKLAGTYASYTQKPVMITMSDAELVVDAPKKAPVKKPVPSHKK